MPNCAVKGCPNKSDPRWFVYDKEGGSHPSCDAHGGKAVERSEIRGEGEDDVEDEAEQECSECGGEGVVEVGPECNVPISECCGGCFRSEPCPECGEEAPEPDWDAIREARAETARDYEVEVDWDVRE